MKQILCIAAVVMLSACATADQQHSATQEASEGSVSPAVAATQSDRIIQEDIIEGPVLGGLIGAYLDAERGDIIHASEVRYHRKNCGSGSSYFSKATRSHDLDERIYLMAEGLELCPDNPAAHNDLGLALILLGDLPTARVHLSHSLRLDPDYNPARINLSRIHYDPKQIEEAEEVDVKGGGSNAAGRAEYHREGRKGLMRYHQNSEAQIERLKRWSDRQKKLAEEHGDKD